MLEKARLLRFFHWAEGSFCGLYGSGSSVLGLWQSLASVVSPVQSGFSSLLEVLCACGSWGSVAAEEPRWGRNAHLLCRSPLGKHTSWQPRIGSCNVEQAEARMKLFRQQSLGIDPGFVASHLKSTSDLETFSVDFIEPVPSALPFCVRHFSLFPAYLLSSCSVGSWTFCAVLRNNNCIRWSLNLTELGCQRA